MARKLHAGAVYNGFTAIESDGHKWLVRHTCGRERKAGAYALFNNEVLCVCRWELSPISAVNAAWLASAIDGEGTICFSASLLKTPAGTLTIKLKPNIAVSNTVRAYPERAMAAAGCGSIGKAKPVGTAKFGQGRSLYFSWDLSQWQQVQHVMRACLPYFVIKGHKAAAMIGCCEYRNSLYQEGSTRLVPATYRYLARYVHDNWMKRFQQDGRGIEACRKFLGEESGS